MEAWNVGANIGVYALQLAHLVGAAGRVVAFEPNPAAREVLVRNIARNSLQSRVEVVPSAVGSAPGTVDFYTSGADGMGRAGRPNPRLSATDRIEVPVTTLDAFASARGRLPDLVVMDIEGWEIAALEGARSHLGRTRFIVELHPDAWQWSGHTRADLEGLLDSGWAGGAPAQRPARPARRAWAGRPRREISFRRTAACLKGNREGEKGRIRDLGGARARQHSELLVTKRTSSPLLSFSCCILGAAVAGISEDLEASRPRFVVAWAVI